MSALGDVYRLVAKTTEASAGAWRFLVANDALNFGVACLAERFGFEGKRADQQFIENIP